VSDCITLRKIKKLESKWKLWITLLDGGWDIPHNDCNDMEYLRTTKIIKTGNSLCVVLPKTILRALTIERGDQVVFGIVDEKTIAIRKINLEELKLLKP
jgi:hypothetical protein